MLRALCPAPAACVGAPAGATAAHSIMFSSPWQADLREAMDPVAQADGAADLNLKLMKWRAAPSLDLARLAATKCLLLGAGAVALWRSKCADCGLDAPVRAFLILLQRHGGHHPAHKAGMLVCIGP